MRAFWGVVLLAACVWAAPLRPATTGFYQEWERHWKAQQPWECKRMLDEHPELGEQAFYDVVQYLQSHPEETSQYRLFLSYVAGMLSDTHPELRATLEEEGLRFRRGGFLRPQKGAAVSGLTQDYLRDFGRAQDRRAFLKGSWQIAEYAFYDLLAHPKEAGAREFLQETAAQFRQDGRPLDERPTRIWQLTSHGEELLAAGRRDEARARLQEAITLVEELVARAGPRAREAMRLRKLHFVPYELLARLQISSGSPREAFDTVGRQQQVESLTQSRLGESDPDMANVMRLRGEGDALQQQLVDAQLQGADTAVVEKQLASNRAEFYQAVGEIRRTHPEYEKMLSVRPVNFSKLQPAIPANTAVVELFPASDQLYIFLATQKDLKIHSVAVSQAEIDGLVGSYRRGATTGKDLQKASARLYELLLKPVEKDLQPYQVVAFIPSGSLHYLPLQALGSPPLITRKQCVTILRSADLDGLFQPARKASGVVLGFGDPDGSLPEAAREVQGIGQLFPGSKLYTGANATSAHLGELSGVAYVHFATHGVLDARDPNASYLRVAGTPDRLTVLEIPGIPLDKVRLVTLSACQTAVGVERMTGGSEVATLADAFSFAGTPAVVASLWSVSDVSTRELMLSFYEGLKAGRTPAQSLQQAQVKMLKTKGREHPFFWAGFQLIGDWR